MAFKMNKPLQMGTAGHKAAVAKHKSAAPKKAYNTPAKKEHVKMDNERWSAGSAKAKSATGKSLNELVAMRKKLEKGSPEYNRIQNEINKALGNKKRHETEKKTVIKDKDAGTKTVIKDKKGGSEVEGGKTVVKDKTPETKTKTVTKNKEGEVTPKTTTRNRQLNRFRLALKAWREGGKKGDKPKLSDFKSPAKMGLMEAGKGVLRKNYKKDAAPKMKHGKK